MMGLVTVDPIFAGMSGIGERQSEALDRELPSFEKVDAKVAELGQPEP
jgi:hypothetical protein